MKKIFKKHRIKFKILSVFVIMAIMILALFYPLMPTILNYPANTYGNDFQWELEHTNYTLQFVEISFAIFVLYSVLLFKKLSFLNDFDEVLEKNDIEKLVKIREKLFKVPNELYILQILVPCLGVPILYAISTNLLGITTLKVFILYTSFITVIATFSSVYVRKQFSEILTQIDIPLNTFKRKSTLTARFYYQITPLIIVALMFTSLIGYSTLVEAEAPSTYLLYATRLKDMFSNETYSSKEEIYQKLANMQVLNYKDKPFVLEPSGKYYDANKNELHFSDFWVKYLNEIALENNSMVYDYYGVDVRGAIAQVNVGDGVYIVGVQYDLTSTGALITLGITIIFLFLLNFITLAIFSKALSGEIKEVANKMEIISKVKNIEDTKNLPITSNDEIGGLIVSFNAVQNLTKENILTIRSSQESLIEQERLASLGQMIGGIAHNLKTPIMSIAGASEGLIELIAEYIASIDDSEVTSADHKEIAKDMLEWVTKIKTHTSYMSEIITTVKDQATRLNFSKEDSFTVYDLSRKVTILMKHEINKALVTLKTDIQCDPSETLHGDINNLIQVINNLISNAIYAYNGQPDGVIRFNISKENDKIVIKIMDEGCGISEEIKNKLFKEMITTKGKNGTGLGLYMSYSTIIGRFNGNMTFTSEIGKGTTFIITIPA